MVNRLAVYTILFACLCLLIQCSRTEVKPAPGTGMIYGKVSEADSHLPLPYVVIWADGGEIKSDTTDLRGRFVIADVKPGMWVVNAHLAGYREIHGTSVTITADSIAEIRIELASLLALDRLDNPIGYYSTLANSR